MRKKILLGSIASLFAVATVFNMGLLNFNKQSDATLDAIAVMAEALGESNYRQDCTDYGIVCRTMGSTGIPLFIQGWGNKR